MSSIFSGVLQNSFLGTTSSLTKTGSGTVTLAGANTYSGPTTINAGALSCRRGRCVSANSAITINNGTLDASSYRR